MPERFINDDRYYVRHEDRPQGSSSASWLVPLLLLPIAFLGGWVASGYVNEGQVNGTLPQIEVGVGGGPEDERQMVSPLPTGQTDPTPTPTTSPTPTEEITSTPQDEE